MTRRRIRVALAGLLAAGCGLSARETLSPPAELGATGGPASIVLWWSAVAGADGYAIYASTAGEPTVPHAIVSGPPFRLAAANTSASWTISIAATRADRESERSASVSARSYHPAMFTDTVLFSAAGGLDDDFGWTVASADVNGDRRADLVVGAPRREAGVAAEAGDVRLFPQYPGGLTDTGWDAQTANEDGANQGFAIATWDGDGDGIAEIVASAPREDGASSDSGQVGVHRGRMPLPTTGRTSTFGLPGFGMRTGFALAAGDVDGDGVEDLVVGAPHPVGANPGRFAVIQGGTLASTLVASQIVVGQSAGNLGWSVAAGDVNGDGRADVVAGEPHYVVGSSGHGRAVLHLGTQTGVTIDPVWSSPAGEVLEEHVGASVAIVGDVDGDGDAEVAVGNRPEFAARAGRIALFAGEPAGLATVESWAFETTELDPIEPPRAFALGDVDSDGFADVAIGEPCWDRPGASDAGRILVFRGGPEGLETEPTWILEGTDADALLGIAVAAADLDSDGVPDLIAGEPRFGGAGRVRVLAGRATAGPRVSAGPPIQSARDGRFAASGAWFHDPKDAAPYRCTWHVDEEEIVVFEDCSPLEPAGGWVFWVRRHGTRTVRLRVVAADGRWGEAVTTVVRP